MSPLESPIPLDSLKREPDQSYRDKHASNPSGAGWRSDDSHISYKPDALNESACDGASRDPPIGLGVSVVGRAQSSSTALSLNTGHTLISDLQKKDALAHTEFEHARAADDDNSDTGATFDDLVERLLSQSTAKSDSKFTVTFLCLYRRFAAPSELLTSVIHHFEDLSSSDAPNLIKLDAQMRCLNILQEWMSDYPGDFAHPSTRRLIMNFVQTLGAYPEFAVAHKEISPYLDILCDDDDTEWACSDRRRSRASTMESFLTTSSIQSATSTVTADSSTEDMTDPVALENPRKEQSSRASAIQSTESGIEQGSQSSRSCQMSVDTVDDARRQAQLLSPIARYVIDKTRWHQLMDIPGEQIALELTRIDWILYSSIRPRDLVRHVTLNVELKERCKSLEFVNRMILQFNHVAFWIANIILLRDKPKHRARALEKFMGVAWKLRYLNNYNSLGAIIAGVNGTAVHRLAQTRDLVSPEARKQFMRLEILMGTAKSHSAYRLGWQNTSTPRIPFLPLHRRDLVFAEEGNGTYIGGDEGERINWKKFEIMGDVIFGIRASQGSPYPAIKRNEEVQRLVLDGKFSKDEDVSICSFRFVGCSADPSHCRNFMSGAFN